MSLPVPIPAPAVQYPQATIVFVTTHSEFMPLIFRYRVAAMDFIDPHSYFYEPIYDHIILVAHV